MMASAMPMPGTMTLTLITTAASVVINSSDESPNWNGGDGLERAAGHGDGRIA